MNIINILKLLSIFSFISMSYAGYEWNSCKSKMNVELGTSKGQLNKQEISEILIEAENICLDALRLEPENAYIPFFIGKEIYESEKRYSDAAKMYIEALKRPDTDLGSQHTLKISRGKYLTSVHKLIKTYAPKWFNYGVDANNKAKYDDAINYFKNASEFDASFIGRSYPAIAEIYYENKGNLEQSLEFIKIALTNIDDEQVITDLKLRMATYLRKNGKIDEAKKILTVLINNEKNNVPVQLQLFHIYMDNSNCLNALEMGPELFIKMEENPRIPMENLSELAFNIGVCYNQEADIKYNLIIEYYGKENKTTELTNKNLEICQETIDYYTLAKEYFRNSQAYEENPSETTKQFKKDMRSKIKRVEEELMPSLEELLE